MLRYQRQPRTHWAPRHSVCLVLLRPHRLPILPHTPPSSRFPFVLHFSPVSLLSCYFVVGGQWLRARCVLGQLPPALHKRHANCRCGLLVGGQVRSVQNNSPKTAAAILLCAELLEKSLRLKDSVCFPVLTGHHKHIMYLNFNVFFYCLDEANAFTWNSNIMLL